MGISAYRGPSLPWKLYPEGSASPIPCSEVSSGSSIEIGIVLIAALRVKHQTGMLALALSFGPTSTALDAESITLPTSSRWPSGIKTTPVSVLPTRDSFGYATIRLSHCGIFTPCLRLYLGLASHSAESRSSAATIEPTKPTDNAGPTTEDCVG
jgi:hypothetical protein